MVNPILKPIITAIIASLIIIPISYIIFISINFGYPNIKLYNDILDREELGNGYTFNTAGLYIPITNTIHIDINLPKDEIVNILYHEYGHYIYYNLDKEDKNKWKNEFCKKADKIGYYKIQICGEEFAEGISNYLNHKMDTKEEWDYFENITSKYLG